MLSQRIAFSLITLVFLVSVTAYPSGAPDDSCVSMKPGHSPPQNTGEAPFAIYVSRTNYSSGDNITVTLHATSTVKFRGFLLQARRINSGLDQNAPVGSFDLGTDTSLIRTACNSIAPNSSVTHRNATEKDTITVHWHAPHSKEGNLRFRATVVEVFDQANDVSSFWENILSAEIMGDAPEPSPTQEPCLQPIDTRECGRAKGCYRYPSQCGSKDCDHLVTWKAHSDHNMVDFELSAKVSSQNSWSAVAFSIDQKMGDDSVNECIYDSKSGTTKVQASWNDNSPTNKVLNDPSLGLYPEHSEASSVDNRIQCKFSRQITILNYTEALPDAGKIYNLSRQFYLFLGMGPAAEGILNAHSVTPVVSPRTVYLNDSKNYVDIGGAVKSPLVITHGCLMIFAWMVLVSVGVFMPRYFKTAWPDSTLRGKAVWFPLHRSAMSGALFMTLGAFIVIFIDVGGYANHLSGLDAAHPVLGIIVTALVIINPIMALFRPHPGTDRRVYFNWAHFLVGTTAQLAGVVTLFAGTRLARARMSSYSQWLVVVAVAWHCVIEITLALYHTCCLGNKKSAREQYDEDNGNSRYDGSVAKTALVILHLTGMLIISFALMHDLISS